MGMIMSMFMGMIMSMFMGVSVCLCKASRPPSQGTPHPVRPAAVRPRGHETAQPASRRTCCGSRPWDVKVCVA